MCVDSSTSLLIAGVIIYESTSLFYLLYFSCSGVIIYESIRDIQSLRKRVYTYEKKFRMERRSQLAISVHKSPFFSKPISATMVACPSNAQDAVKETVLKASGYISNYAAGEGTAEAIRFFRAYSNFL